jgi:hypothetical protein
MKRALCIGFIAVLSSAVLGQEAGRDSRQVLSSNRRAR